jgi:hypothetical protein
MQKSWQKFQTLLDRLDDIQTNEISFCWKEQCLNYKFCTRHIFPERTWNRGKAKNQHLWKKFLQHFCNLKSLYFSIIFSCIDQIWRKNTRKCSASKALSISSLVKFFRSLLDSLIKTVWNMKFLQNGSFYKIHSSYQNISRHLQKSSMNWIFLRYLV